MKEVVVQWIKDYFEQAGPECKVVIGISGGKDSSVAAAACVEALGKERVIGVMMPQGVQGDIDYSKELVELLGIKSYTFNIGETVSTFINEFTNVVDEPSVQTKTNIPARIRMTTLYAIAQTVGGRVCNTCNKSEDWVGYSTKYGDAAGDFSPLSEFTVREVKQIGRELGLPEKFIEKPPIDGLCGKTDEDNLGFKYEELDEYIINGVEPEEEKMQKIKRLHAVNLHKLELMPACPNPIIHKNEYKDWRKALIK